MFEKIEKFCLGIIFFGLGITLAIPLITNSNFIFPFIFPKVIVFRITVEIIFLAYLFLAFLNQEYRPRINLIFASVLFFIVAIFFSSLIGQNFYLSFWGDIERGEGLILWLHLLAYLLILINVLNKEKNWLYFFDVSLFFSILLCGFALAQIFQVESILNTTGERIASTVGNPAFFGAYLMFQLAFAAYLFLKRNNLFLKIYYSVLFIFFSYIIMATKTRGTFLGLLAAFLMGAFLFIFKSKNRITKAVSVSLVSLIIILTFFIYFNRQQAFVKNNSFINRFTSISLTDKTAKTRLAAWGAAWQGWQKNFIFGYGLENYYIVFDKYFPSIIYEDVGSQVWFDRAHNFIFDRGVTSGIVGLGLYLVFILLPVFYFAKDIFKKKLDSEEERDEVFLAVVFLSFIIGFLIQNLFVFETITTYVILIFTWGFLAFKLTKKELLLNFNKWYYLSIFVIYLILLGPIVWLVNIKPAQANSHVSKALQWEKGLKSPDPEHTIFDIVDQFKYGLESKTYGVPEFRLQFIELIYNQLANLGAVTEAGKPVVAYTDEQVTKQLEENNNSAKYRLLAMRYYNYTYGVYPGQEIARLDKALSYFPKLEELSPTRPHVYQEAGFTNLFKYQEYLKLNQLDLANQSLAEANKYFRKTIELSPMVVESYINLIMLHLNAKEDDKISAVIEEMDKSGVNYKTPTYLNNLIQLSIGNKNYQWAVNFGEELIKIDQNNLGAWNNLAIAYASLGNNEKAIETAEKIRVLFAAQGISQGVDTFIQEVKSGVYKK